MRDDLIEELARLAESRPHQLIDASANRCEKIAAWLRGLKSDDSLSRDTNHSSSRSV